METASELEVELAGAGAAPVAVEPDSVIEPEGTAEAAADGSELNDAEIPVAFWQDGGVAVAFPGT